MSFGLIERLLAFLRVPSRFGAGLCTAWLHLASGVGLLAAQQSALPTSIADRLSFAHLTINDGLSQSNVLTVLQDHLGFMWFGTAEGLNKFDGYSWTLYKHDPVDSTSLSDNYVEVVYEDRAGTLWVGTSNGGINRFDRRQERFTRFVDDSIGPHGITWFYEDTFGRFWLSTQGGGLLEMDRETGRFERYRHDSIVPTTLSDNDLWQITQDVLDPGFLWIATQNGLNRLDIGSGEFEHFVHDPDDPESLSHSDIRALHMDDDGTLWVGTWAGGLNRFDRAAGTFTRFMAAPTDPDAGGRNRIWDIEEDPSALGTLFLATYGAGLLRFDTSTERITSYRHDPDNPLSVGSDNLKFIHVDRADAVWLGTWNGGVSRIDRPDKPFNHVSRLDGLTHQPVLAIAEDPAFPNTVWLGTWGAGLSRIELASGQVTAFRNDPADPTSLSYDRARVLTVDRSGTLWAGTEFGLNRYDPTSETFTRFESHPTDPNSLSPHAITELGEDPSSPGTLWLGFYDGGLQRLTVPDGSSPLDARFVSFHHDPDDANSLSHDRVQALHLDASGIVWVGTLAGVDRFDPQTGEYTNFSHDPGDANSLSHNSVLTIHEIAGPMGSPTALWIGTDDGLNRMEPDPTWNDGVRVTRFGESDGLPSTMIYGILEDDGGRLWLTTNKGLSRFDPGTNVFTNYDVSDGLQGNEFEGGSYFRSRSGWMYVGGLNGFNFFHPDSIGFNQHVPPVVITGLRINNSIPGIGQEDSPLRQHITQTEALTLSHEQNVVSLEFAALDYTAPHKNQYAYRMDGFDDDWQDGGNRRLATYTNLDPGRYVFRVRGSNNDGIWNDEGASVQITILPPWWRTWWAYTLYGIAALGLLSLSRQYELNRIRLKNQLELEHVEAQKLRELDTVKSRFFANLSHEFRTPLTLTIGPLEDLRSGTRGTISEEAGTDLDLALRNSRRLLKLVNQMLDVARLEAGHLEPKIHEDDLGALLRGLAESFAPLAERRRIDFRVEIADLDLCVFFDADLLEKVFTNLLSNAFKFTPEGGTVVLRTSVTGSAGSPGVVVVTVRDSGSGIERSELSRIFERFYRATQTPTQGTGIGLSLAKELVELHGGRISVSSELGLGSTFSVELLLGSAHLNPDWLVDGPRPLELAERPMPANPEEGASATPAKHPAAPLDLTTVLIVDDSQEVRAYLRRHLAETFRVLEAEDGQEGLDVARRESPDVVISDVMMPVMSGIELCRALKSDRTTNFIPVILVTAKASPEEKLAGLDVGADDYVTKPFDPIELAARARNLVQARRRLWEHARFEARFYTDEPVGESEDERLLERIRRTVEAHLDDESFDVETLALALGYSRASLYRRLEGVIDDSPAEIILNLRLERAAALLGSSKTSVGEVAYGVGFKSVSHFSRRFKRRFGVSPSEFESRSTV